MTQPRPLTDLKGFVCGISITGSILPQYAKCFEAMHIYMERQGFQKIEWDMGRPGLFIESSRDDVVMHALDPRKDRSEPSYDWVLMVDCDATFPQETLHRLLTTAYVTHPQAGVVGAYCQLKPYPHLPTIDTGTGTWEEHYPGEGVLPIIRTGCHCILIKTQVFSKIGPPPWFRTRLAQQPIRAMREVDNYARIRLSGRNPFREHPEWGTLIEAASQDSLQKESVVGEDSAFFDRCRAHNVPCFVDTDLVTGHVAQRVLQPADYRDAVTKNRKMQRAALGVLG